MMCDPLTTPADARAPDADRAGADASARLSQWVVHLIALVVRCMLERMFAGRSHRSPLPSWLHERPDLPLASTQAEAASLRGPFGRSIAWMCRRYGIGPEHPDWPELSRTIVAFGGSVKSARPGLPALGLLWWENPNVTPGCAGETAPTPAADAMALLLSRLAAAAAPAGTGQHGSNEPCAFRRGAGTAACARAVGLCPYRNGSADRAALYHRAARYLGASIFLCLHERGQSMAGPAVLIRAECKFPVVVSDTGRPKDRLIRAASHLASSPRKRGPKLHGSPLARG